CLPRAARPRTRRAAPPARRARRPGNAPRPLRLLPSPSARHLALDPRRVLLVRLRLGRELDDALLAVERVAAPDVDVRPLDLDDVVAGPAVTSQARGRDGAGVDDEEVFEPPRIGHVLVAGPDQVDTRALQALERVAGVVDDV